MAKPNRKIQPVQKVLKKDTAAQLPGAQTGYNFLYVLLITAYFVVDLIKPSQIIDNMGFQWLCITVLNLLGLLLAFRDNHIRSASLKDIFGHPIFYLFAAFILLSGLSIFESLNRVESLVVYSRLLASSSAVLLFLLLLYRRLISFADIALAITLVGLWQALQANVDFFKALKATNLNDAVYGIKGTASNKNIFGVSLSLKIPFIIYTIFKRKYALKIVAILALILVLLMVFFINSRTGYLVLILEFLILSVGLAYVYFKEKLQQHFFYNFGFILAAAVLSFGIAQSTLKQEMEKSTSNTYGTVTDRLASIGDQSDASGNIRLQYWKLSWDLIKEKPLRGHGYGTYKLVSVPGVNKLQNEGVYSKHPHNDFFEIAVESGLVNVAIYLAIFVLAFIYTLCLLFSGKSTLRIRVVALIAFATFAGYFVDAFFNFPLERPTTQILYAIALALIIRNFLDARRDASLPIPPVSNKSTLVFLGLATLFAALQCYALYITYQSFKAQFLVNVELMKLNNDKKTKPAFSAADLEKMYPTFPNIGENTQSIGYQKARFLLQENRLDEAIKLIDSVDHFTPLSAYNDYMKADIYERKAVLDSTYVYLDKAFAKHPRNLIYYRSLMNVLAKRKDFKEIERVYQSYKLYRDDNEAYYEYVRAQIVAGASNAQVKALLVDGHARYPSDERLTKWYNQVVGIAQ